MKRSQLKLRQKLLLLLVGISGIGLTAFILVLAIADYQLSEKFVPENQALRDVESRSALLIQNYFRFMLTPDLISVSVLDGELTLIRDSLDKYEELVTSDQRKRQLAASIAESIDELELAGKEMILARQGFIEIYSRQEQLEADIDRVFMRYRAAISTDIGISIENQDWNRLAKDFLPEIRMIDSVNQQFLQLFLNIREYQIDPGREAFVKINSLKKRIDFSNSMFELYVVNSTERAQLSASILGIYKRMLDVVDAFTHARQKAEYAVSRAEQSGIDLNESMQDAIAASEAVGWQDLRQAMFISGGVLLVTLVISYLLIYAGFNRILRPLEKLQTVISRLGKGDFKQRAKDTARTDEIGQLAAAFNLMADQLEINADQRQQFIEQLEQKNMELERFTYTVSHELKSPLVTVNGFLGLLSRDLGDDKSDKVLNDMHKIESAISTMSKQLEDLLELSRVGRVVNPPQAFRLTDTCRNVLDTMQGPIAEAGALVEVEDKMPRVYADEIRVREVVQNLVENAIKFSRPGGRPHIDISAEARADIVLCRVRDNGPGIEPQYHDKVFELFDRLDSDIPGTGIGLALVKRIIEIHGGKIWIEPVAETSGTCFVFELPAVAAANP